MSHPNVEYMNPPTLSAPTGYTHVVQVHRGRTVYIAGQVAFDKSGNVVGKGDFCSSNCSKSHTARAKRLKASILGLQETACDPHNVTAQI